jgi:hypothetical protein
LSPGCFPNGAAATELNHTNANGKKYGAVAYTEPLTEKQINSYELNYIDPIREMNDVECWMINN